MPFRSLCLIASLVAACSGPQGASTPTRSLPEPIVGHEEWEAHRPGGVISRGVRRNLAPGDSVAVDGLVVRLLEVRPSGAPDTADTVLIELVSPDETASRTAGEGTAFNWSGFHIAILASRTGEDELGSGYTELEASPADDLPGHIADARVAGDAAWRLRIPHEIEMITLHHSGSPEPLRPEDDVPAKLRDLQLWSESDRNWWDVPYHFLIGLDGTIYEGRDYRFRGETNTDYDVSGHLLISVLGNYSIQESTPEQIEAITDLMAWGVATFDVPLDRIYGHSDLAATECPGTHLRKYLEDGTFRSGVTRRLAALPGE